MQETYPQALFFFFTSLSTGRITISCRLYDCIFVPRACEYFYKLCLFNPVDIDNMVVYICKIHYNAIFDFSYITILFLVETVTELINNNERRYGKAPMWSSRIWWFTMNWILRRPCERENLTAAIRSASLMMMCLPPSGSSRTEWGREKHQPSSPGHHIWSDRHPWILRGLLRGHEFLIRRILLFFYPS